jgi:cytochrome bd-type quinol oxidase subunit 2
MKLLADTSIPGLFGTIAPPVGGIPTDPGEAIGKIMSVGMQLIFIIAFLSLLIMMLLGGLDWISSNGEKEKITKAQNKITNAAVGMLIMVLVLTFFVIVSNTIFGGKVIWFDQAGMHFKIPTIGP